MLFTVNRSFVAGFAVASKPDITQAWAPRHISSPTGRRVSAIARTAVAMASPRERTETTTYGPSPSSFSAPAQPSGSDPGPTSRSLESERARRSSWRCEGTAASRAQPGAIRFAIVWIAAGTHQSARACETKSPGS